MFLGHYGVAFALKRAEPRVSLGTLFLAVALVDTLWGIFLLAGWESARIFPGLTPVTPIEFTHYPLTHSLVAAFGWGLLAAFLVYSKPTRDTSRHHWLKAVAVGGAVASHWFLDAVVHLPDLPVSGSDSPRVGLALWENLPATLAVELGLFGAGLALYLAWRRSKGQGSTTRILALAAVLAGLYAASLLAAPPSMTVVAVAAVAGTILLAMLAGWADRAAAPSR